MNKTIEQATKEYTDVVKPYLSEEEIELVQNMRWLTSGTIYEKLICQKKDLCLYEVERVVLI